MRTTPSRAWRADFDCRSGFDDQGQTLEGRVHAVAEADPFRVARVPHDPVREDSKRHEGAATRVQIGKRHLVEPQGGDRTDVLGIIASRSLITMAVASESSA